MKKFSWLAIILGLSLSQVVFAESINLLPNGSFEKDLLYWESWANGCREGFYNGIFNLCEANVIKARKLNLSLDEENFVSVNNSKKSLRIILEGLPYKNDWEAHLQSTLDPRFPLNIPAGKYRLKFWAKAEKSFKASVGLVEATAPYKNLGLLSPLEINSTWKEYVYEFETKGAKSSSILLKLGLAPEKVGINIDEMSLSLIVGPKIKDAKISIYRGSEITLHLEKVNPFADYKVRYYVWDFADVKKTYKTKQVKFLALPRFFGDTVKFVLPENTLPYPIRLENVEEQSNEVPLEIKEIPNFYITKIIRTPKTINKIKKVEITVFGKNFGVKGEAKVSGVSAEIISWTDSKVVLQAPNNVYWGTLKMKRLLWGK